MLVISMHCFCQWLLLQPFPIWMLLTRTHSLPWHKTKTKSNKCVPQKHHTNWLYLEVTPIENCVQMQLCDMQSVIRPILHICQFILHTSRTDTHPNIIWCQQLRNLPSWVYMEERYTWASEAARNSVVEISDVCWLRRSLSLYATVPKWSTALTKAFTE